ncbi:hypothetical protein NLX62_08110, partial [Mycobacteriaceae bacterium Msp059]|nr:hypothetical protein [Mycobacteriaceae bacterium Msp059]
GENTVALSGVTIGPGPLCDDGPNPRVRTMDAATIVAIAATTNTIRTGRDAKAPRRLPDRTSNDGRRRRPRAPAE